MPKRELKSCATYLEKNDAPAMKAKMQKINESVAEMMKAAEKHKQHDAAHDKHNDHDDHGMHKEHGDHKKHK